MKTKVKKTKKTNKKDTPDLMTEMKDAEKSMMGRVYEIILDDPGVSCSHISRRLETDGKSVSHALAGLRRAGRITNRGKQARGASWYPMG